MHSLVLAVSENSQGTVSLNVLGGKLALKLVYFALKKELLLVSLSEMAPATSTHDQRCKNRTPDPLILGPMP